MTTQSRLKELFRYCRKSGKLIRIKRQGRGLVGQTVEGSLHHTGYLQFKVDDKTIRYHRAVFLFHKGYLPKLVDHKDQDKTNNRIGNLRDATRSQNAHNSKMFKNNTSGFKGVFYEKDDKLWSARIQINGVRKRLGYFKTPEQASRAYQKAKRQGGL